MNTVLAAILCGCFGFGVLLAVAGLRRPVRSLTSLGLGQDSATAASYRYTGFFGWIDETVGHQTGTDLTSDLAILSLTRSVFETRRLVSGAVAAILPFLFFILYAFAFGAFPLAALSLMVTIIFFAAGFFGYWWMIHSQAQNARKAMRHGLSMFLDLAVLQLAGGAGVAASLDSAAERGDGDAFRRIRSALQVASTQGQSLTPYESLRRLGEQLSVTDLIDVGNAMDRADSTGGEVKSALRRQAHRVRTRLAQDEKAAAGSRSVTMTLPQTLMLAGFMIFLLYPFIASIAA